MAQLRKRLRLDLTDALTRDAELAPDFLKCARMTVFETETQADDLALALCEAVQHLCELLLQHREAGSIGRNHGCIVLDEVAELGILLLADGRLE